MTPTHTYALFIAIAASGILSLLPIKVCSRRSWILHAYIPTLIFYLLYELTLPRELWLRVDLVLILPFLLVVVVVTVLRWSKFQR